MNISKHTIAGRCLILYTSWNFRKQSNPKQPDANYVVHSYKCYRGATLKFIANNLSRCTFYEKTCTLQIDAESVVGEDEQEIRKETAFQWEVFPIFSGDFLFLEQQLSSAMNTLVYLTLC